MLRLNCKIVSEITSKIFEVIDEKCSNCGYEMDGECWALKCELKYLRSDGGVHNDDDDED